MPIWIAIILLFVAIIALEASNRYVRFRNVPAAWSLTTLLIRAVIWIAALLIASNVSSLGLTPATVIGSLAFGAVYFAVMFLIGQLIAARSGAADPLTRDS